MPVKSRHLVLLPFKPNAVFSTPPDQSRPPAMNNLQSVGRQTLQHVQRQAERFPWQFWAIVLILLSGGLGFTATTMLFRLPKSPQCSQIFWPIASASLRLYCGQVLAEERTTDSLLRAIELVAALPKDHPLYREGSQNIEMWANELLDLAEESYQAGNLEEAIATARRIPDHVEAYKLVEKRIATWQETWKEGEAIYAEVEANLRKADWNGAFRDAVKLLNLDSRYWSTTKYNESLKNIQLAQEESSKLDTAYRILRQGGVDNWLKAIAEAKKIPKTSYAYQESQGLVDQAKEKIQDYVQSLIEKKDWQTLASTTDRIPEEVFPTEDLNDWQMLGDAGSDAQSGTLEGIQTAIATLGRMTDQTRPYYSLAQELMTGWQKEEKALTQLAKAREKAASGSLVDLNTAIAEARTIPQENPRYRDALQDINTWTKQVQIYEDKPILTKAKEIAAGGNVVALEQAIQQAATITNDRALYGEAKKQMREWQEMVERQEDQPLLDQASSLASNQDYQGAINTASQIRSGRSLYRSARQNMNRWQQQIQAQRDLQRANTLAESRTPEGLSNAIRLARQLPSSTDAGSQRTQVINTWSYQLLSIAQEKASVSQLSEAIRLARAIPKESVAYSTARDLIKDWQRLLTPATPAPIVSPPAPAIEEMPDLQLPNPNEPLAVPSP
jgi:hypothetical protein